MIHLTLPEPPSANRYWRTFRGRAVKSKEARAFVEAVRTLALVAKVKPILAGPVKLTVVWYRSRKMGDLSNRLKIVEDAMNGVCYTDDKQVSEIVMRRVDGVKPGRMDITVEAL